MTDSATPVASGVRDAVGISAGDGHTCAVRTNREVQCWGAGLNGQLGDGRSVSSPTPVTVVGLGAPAPPVLEQSVTVEPVSGVVRVKPAGAASFTRLTGPRSLPLDSTVDATGGKVRLTSAVDPAGTTQSGLFEDGEFQIGQGDDGLTDLTLSGPLPTGCGRARRGREAAEEEGPAPLGRREGQLPQQREARLGDGAGHPLARRGHVRGDARARRARRRGGRGPRDAPEGARSRGRPLRRPRLTAADVARLRDRGRAAARPARGRAQAAVGGAGRRARLLALRERRPAERRGRHREPDRRARRPQPARRTLGEGGEGARASEGRGQAFDRRRPPLSRLAEGLGRGVPAAVLGGVHRRRARRRAGAGREAALRRGVQPAGARERLRTWRALDF